MAMKLCSKFSLHELLLGLAFTVVGHTTHVQNDVE